MSNNLLVPNVMIRCFPLSFMMIVRLSLLDCWLEQRSDLQTSLYALGHCNQHKSTLNMMLAGAIHVINY